MMLVKILISKLTKEELALLCDSYDCGDFEFNIMPELIEQDAKNRPAIYAYKCHVLKRNKTASKSQKPGMKKKIEEDVELILGEQECLE